MHSLASPGDAWRIGLTWLAELISKKMIRGFSLFSLVRESLSGTGHTKPTKGVSSLKRPLWVCNSGWVKKIKPSV